MARARRILSSEYPYHITARCINRDWFRLPLDTAWAIFEDYFYLSHHTDRLLVHAFVLMSNHFHLIASTPEANLDRCMLHFMTNVSREITYQSNRINQTFGGPYHATLISSPRYYLHAYKYLYRNPVEAGLAARVEEYPYSTLAGLIGRRRLAIPMLQDDTLGSDLEGTLKWMNTKYADGDREEIRRALKRPEFTFGRERATRRVSQLEFRNS